jgi:hypothetical protein
VFYERGEPLRNPPGREPEKPVCSEIRYNHYFTRSMQEFEQKLRRGRVSGSGYVIDPEFRRRMSAEIEAMSCADTAIDRHLPGLVNRLKAHSLVSAGETISRYARDQQLG